MNKLFAALARQLPGVAVTAAVQVPIDLPGTVMQLKVAIHFS